MPLLVLQFDDDKGLGLLETPLLESGVGLDLRLAERRSVLSTTHAGLVVLGGIAAPDDDSRPEIVAALELIRKALARPIPVLGICLGAELLARAAAGSVQPCAPEYGYRAVRLARAGASDPLTRRASGDIQRSSGSRVHLANRPRKRRSSLVPRVASRHSGSSRVRGECSSISSRPKR